MVICWKFSPTYHLSFNFVYGIFWHVKVLNVHSLSILIISFWSLSSAFCLNRLSHLFFERLNGFLYLLIYVESFYNSLKCSPILLILEHLRLQTLRSRCIEFSSFRKSVNFIFTPIYFQKEGEKLINNKPTLGHLVWW